MVLDNAVNILHAIELFTLKWFVVCEFELDTSLEIYNTRALERAFHILSPQTPPQKKNLFFLSEVMH